jgi:DNA-binding transcriptional regulator YdaS (Cro superfamily)
MTTLKAWLDAESGRASALADHLKAGRSTVSQAKNGKIPVPWHWHSKIEVFTAGAVTAGSLAQARTKARDKKLRSAKGAGRG